MKINLGSSNDDVRIEIIPLMDVIFCILTFFILGAVGLTRQQAISNPLPQVSTGEAVTGNFYVGIDFTGQIYVGKESVPISFEELPERLDAHLQNNPDSKVLVLGNPKAEYDDVLQVMDVLRSVGGDRVMLVVQPSDTDPLERNRQRRSPFEVMPTTPPNSETRSPIPGLTPSPTDEITPDELTPDEMTSDEADEEATLDEMTSDEMTPNETDEETPPEP
ncbi:biopolymer transporter ExbD [Geitlerinema sp. CS-897]|nr:biopolymer transporter ExbD [Geitlerinema sp. CS-897]